MAFSFSNVTGNIGLLAGVAVGVIAGGFVTNYLQNNVGSFSGSPYLPPLIVLFLGIVLSAFDNPLIAGIGYGMVGYGVYAVVKTATGGQI